MKKIILENILPGLFILIIGAVVGGLISNHYEKESNKHRYLQYETIVDPNIIEISEESLAGDIEFIYKKEIINNLTSVDAKIFNFSDKDYEDVPVFIVVKHNDSDQIRIVNFKYTDRNQLPDGIEYLGKETSQNETKFSFIIKNASLVKIDKKTNIFKDIFKLSFIILGEENIDVKVLQNKSSLELQKFNQWKYFEKDFLNTPAGVIVIMIFASILYFVLLIAVNRLSKIIFAKKRELKKKRKKEFIIKNVESKFPDIKHVEEIIENIELYQKEFIKRNVDPVTRLLLSPILKDLLKID